ncbi:hypothetical protein JB92DRAFT_2868742 [Gautieria morchelliformis]|nr:hypothetical protein JB92DRAFT_2868742 [Gautieria morchelliformis]
MAGRFYFRFLFFLVTLGKFAPSVGGSSFPMVDVSPSMTVTSSSRSVSSSRGRFSSLVGTGELPECRGRVSPRHSRTPL